MTISTFVTSAVPELILASSSITLLGIGSLWTSDAVKKWTFNLSLSALLLASGILFFTPSLRDIAFSGHFLNDSFSVFLKFIIVLCAFFVLLNLRPHLSYFRVYHFEFPILLLLSTLGMLVFVSANDFLPLYVGLELQSLALYIIIGLHHEEPNTKEAIIKYFILGAIASAFILFGISLIYGYLGTTNFNVSEDLLSANEGAKLGLIIGLVFILCGLGFKVSAVPFHMWTPDVYQGTPYPLLIFLTTAPKIAALGVLMRLLCGPLYSSFSVWHPILMTIALLSMIFGAVAAVVQTNLRRFLAYAAISSMGFSLLGVALGNEAGIKASLFYSVIYLIATMGFLTVIMVFLRREMTMESLTDLKGIAPKKIFSAVSLAIFILTMAGLPPFPGFLGKLFLLQAVVSAELYTIAVVLVLSSVISVYYYLKILKIMFFDSSNNETSIIASFTATVGLNYLVVAFSILILVGLIIFPKYLLNWTTLAASTLFYA